MGFADWYFARKRLGEIEDTILQSSMDATSKKEDFVWVDELGRINGLYRPNILFTIIALTAFPLTTIFGGYEFFKTHNIFTAIPAYLSYFGDWHIKLFVLFLILAIGWKVSSLLLKLRFGLEGFFFYLLSSAFVILPLFDWKPLSFFAPLYYVAFLVAVYYLAHDLIFYKRAARLTEQKRIEYLQKKKRKRQRFRHRQNRRPRQPLKEQKALQEDGSK